ncbi:MAG TPA: NADH-quinone oxidoreductase subunit NuoH [Tepidisphaeraceae bacterium]|nr:NADH-quinone oxidoreductase subunit NuoH [Tepidisphaeraceae bacterium]
MQDWIISHIPPWVWIAFIVHGAVLGTVAYLILLERKTASWVQDRLGPNRVGPWGLFQPLADGLKFIVKEDYRPAGVDKVLFTIAPGIMMLVIIISIAVIPWGGIKQTTVPVGAPVSAGATIVSQDASSITYRWYFQIANLNIGVLYVIAVLSLSVYGVVIGGWASNNKFSFLGGLRATANMISYEIPLGLCVLCIVLMFGTLDLNEIVAKQAHYWLGFIPAWNVFTQPLAFVLFLICIHAEANRAPFDLAEAEQELVGGYHTEYSAMRFALFFLAEYAGMITTSCVCVALFFGGWHFPGLSGNVDPKNPAITTSFAICILRAIVFFAKTIVIIFIFMWVRWSLPRFRFDQVMDLAWRALIPISLALAVFTAILVWLTGGATLDSVRGIDAIYFFGMNALVLLATVLASKILPTPAATNRRLKVSGSRFATLPTSSLN